MTGIHEKPPHFVLLPFLAQGHLIPMVDIARLLARRGVVVTVLVTPHNGNRVKKVIDRAIDSGLTIQLLHLKLPCAEAGLPEGFENVDMLPSMNYALKLFTATEMLKDQVEELLKSLVPKPSCLIADMCFPWTTKLAQKFEIPRMVFHGTSCFGVLCMKIAVTSDLEGVASDTEYFELNELPGRIEITKAQLRGGGGAIPPGWLEKRREILEADDEAFGTVVNTFEELEPEYIQEYMKTRGVKAWCIGPVSLCNRDDSDKADRGNNPSIDKQHCLKWLDSQEPSSVIYACLGSISRLSTSQIIELGLGLEASNRPFIWVVREPSDAFKTWLLEDKFEERTKGRGLLILGWAPQVLILSHPSVGGFITHCGWNSTLEGVTSGRPMITWPVFAEQFSNEKFIVNVIKTGIRVGVEMPVVLGEEEDVGVQVKSDDVKMAIDKLMDVGEEGEERRERARKLGEIAKSAVEEGGSSYNNMTQLIQDVIMEQAKHGDQSANDSCLDQ